jgi:hypothetical protein
LPYPFNPLNTVIVPQSNSALWDCAKIQTARWYERFGAIRLLDDPLKLILPLAAIAEARRGYVLYMKYLCL